MIREGLCFMIIFLSESSSRDGMKCAARTVCLDGLANLGLAYTPNWENSR